MTQARETVTDAMVDAACDAFKTSDSGWPMSMREALIAALSPPQVQPCIHGCLRDHRECATCDDCGALVEFAPNDRNATPPQVQDADNFRRQLLGQLGNVACGNASAEETVTYVMDLIGNTKISAIDATMAEEIRTLRLKLGHEQYVNSTAQVQDGHLPVESMDDPTPFPGHDIQNPNDGKGLACGICKKRGAELAFPCKPEPLVSDDLVTRLKKTADTVTAYDAGYMIELLDEAAASLTRLKVGDDLRDYLMDEVAKLEKWCNTLNNEAAELRAQLTAAQEREVWHPIEAWNWGHGKHVIGYSEKLDEVAEFMRHDDGWTIAAFNGQVHRDSPKFWRKMPDKPRAATAIEDAEHD